MWMNNLRVQISNKNVALYNKRTFLTQQQYMSQFFKNTFGKDDSQHNLQYDNTAFLYFTISISVTAAVITFVMLIKEITRGGNSRRQLNLVKSDPLFNQKVKFLKSKLPSTYFSISFISKLILLAVLILFSVVAYQKASSSSTTLKGFDPYQLLGVQYDSSIPQIRKAYRKLALELHPDRNPNNPEAAAKFIFVSKAYECLTDETIREKCLKYGNPQGSSSFNVGIALPSFLIQRENHVFVMLGIFAILLLVIPKVFLNWNSKFQTKDTRGILVENYYLLYTMFVKDMSYPNIMKTLSQMKEVEDPKLKKIVKDPNSKNEVSQKQIPKGNAAVNKEQHGGCCGQDHGEDQEEQHHHEDGMDCEDHHHEEPKKDFEQFRESLVLVPQTEGSVKNLQTLQKYIKGQTKYDKFLQQIPNLLREMAYFSLDFCTKSMRRKKVLFQDNSNLIIPYMGTNAYHQILNISKNFYQNAQTSDHGLEDLTLDPEEIEELSKEFKIRKIVTEQNTRNQFLKKIKNPEKKELLKKQIQLLPSLNMQVQTLAGEVSQKTFSDRDIVTFKFKITKNPTHGVAFLPRFGYLKRQKFYLTLEAEGELMYIEEVIFEPGQTQYTTSYSYTDKTAQSYSFLMVLRSDCYFGLDVGKQIPLVFTEYKGSDKIHFHKQDLYVQRMPKGYFEEMMTLEMTNPQDDELSQTADEDNQADLEEPERNHSPMQKIEE